MSFDCPLHTHAYQLTSDSPAERGRWVIFLLVGTKSTVHLNIANQTLVQYRVTNLPGPLGRLAYGLDQTRQAAATVVRNCARFARSDFPALPGLGHLISAFYDSIEYDHDVPISYEHILRVSTWLDEVINRLETTRAVRL